MIGSPTLTNYTFSKTPTINFNTTPASIARSATGSVYDVGDTGYTTPLNMTLVVGGAVVTMISSDALGLLPDFTLLDRTTCVWKQTGASFATVLTTSDPIPGPPGPNTVPTDTAIANNITTAGTQTAAALFATYAQQWKANTAYAAGQPVVNPSGDVVTAKTAFTSGATYDATKWNLSTSYVGNSSPAFDAARSIRDVALRPFYAQLAAGGSQTYVLGHSVVAATGASIAALGFPTLIKNAILAADPTAVLNVSGNPGKTSGEILALFSTATANQNATYTSLTIFMGLLNDYYYGVDPATTKSNLQAIIGKMRLIQPAGKDVPAFLILLEWLRGDVASPAYPWDSYRAVAKEVAAADPTVAILDVGTRMGPADTANVNGLYSGDKAHPVDKGHRFIANATIAEILAPVRPSPNPTPALIQVDPKMGPSIFIAGSWATAVNASYLGNGVYYNSSNGLNDLTSYDLVLAPGTWAFDITYAKNTNGGIITVSLDDGAGNFTTLGTIDTYAAAAAYNQVATLANNVLTGSGRVRRLRLQVTGRNASNTTGYYANLQYIQARKTA